MRVVIGVNLNRPVRPTLLPVKPRPGPLVALAGVAAVAGLVLREVRKPYRTPDAVNSFGRLERNLRLARLGANSGQRYARLKAKQTFASAERRDELNREFQIRTAADVTAELGNMKGAMMKLGQMASYLDTGLPDHVRQTLSSLQHDAPPMSDELVVQRLVEEFGKPPEELFLEWDPVPIAAASIGQVHRAITHDDRAVAVKIQYPGVADAMASDLHNVDFVFGALGSVFPGLDSKPVIEELKERLIEELDYLAEARNQRYFAEFFDRHPFITVPQVLDHLSTATVLTTELADGVRFDEMLTWDSHEHDLAAETIFRFTFGSIYRLHAFNGDPHPGNYLFEPGGKVTFLDFGLVKRFVPDESVLFEDLIVSMVLEQDIEKFRLMVENAGLLAPDPSISDDQVADYFQFFYRYLLIDEEVTLDAAYAAEGVSQIFDANGPNKELMKLLNVPPAFVVLQRINLGLMGLMAQMEATRNWRRIGNELWPFVADPPSTPMGEKIEAWRQTKKQTRFGI